MFPLTLSAPSVPWLKLKNWKEVTDATLFAHKTTKPPPNNEQKGKGAMIHDATTGHLG